MVIASNGLQVTVGQVIGGALTDTKEKPLNFKIEKGASSPSLIARGKDGQLYSVGLDSALVTLIVAPKPDYKQLRKEGRPIPKDKAKEADEKIKKEKERNEKVAKGEMKPEDAAKEAAKEAEAEEQEEETEEEKEKETEEDTKKESGSGGQSTLTKGRGSR